MIKILLCCEGVVDQGRDEYSGGEFTHSDGVMQIFIKKLTQNDTLSFSVKTRGDIKRFSLVPLPGNFAPKERIYAKRLAAVAKTEGCEYIAYHRDEDNKGFTEMYAQVQSYFSIAKCSGIKCLAIVPKHMTESWLLSDEKAFPKKPISPTLPKRPEEAWGQRGSDKHPKKYLERVLDQFNFKPTSSVFCDVARRSDVSVLRAKCPESFGQFCSDVGELFTVSL